MLKKKHRITTKEFTTFFAKGRRLHNKYLTIVYIPSNLVKVAVVVSKKITNKKPLKNKLRRRVYAILAQKKEPCFKKGIYIIFVKKDALRASYAMLAKSLQELLIKTQ